MPCIVFQSDFGLWNGSSQLAGVCKRVSVELKLFDLTHDVPKFSIETASKNLAQMMTAWPKGSVFVSIVDPGANPDMTLCAAETDNGYIVFTPDNGTLTDAARSFGIKRVRSVNALSTSYVKTEKSALSHGRDLAYCAACFASGKLPFEQLGPEYPAEDIVLL